MMIKAGPVASPLIPASATASQHESNDEPFSAVLNDKLAEKGKSPLPADRPNPEQHPSKNHKQREEIASDLLGLALPQPGKDILNLQGEVGVSTEATSALPLDAAPVIQAAIPSMAASAAEALPATGETTDDAAAIQSRQLPGAVATSADQTARAAVTAETPLAAVQQVLAGEAEQPGDETKSGSLQRATLRTGADLPSLFAAQKSPLAAATSVAELKYSPLATPAPAAATPEAEQSGVTALTRELEPVTADAPTLKHDAPLGEIPLSGVSATPDAVAKSPLPAQDATPVVLNQPLGTPAWQHALGQQLSYFTRNGVHNAELRLHPEELGALQINLQLNNDKAQLHFVTNNHQVRAAIEAAMPHLRTSLEESGIALGQSSVGEEASSSWQSPGQQDKSGRLNRLMENEEKTIAENEITNITRTMQIHNGINTFV